jgi:hypothetical protein
MTDLIQPETGEFVAYLIARGDVATARLVQDAQVTEGRNAALNDLPFNMARPAAWQTGYVEALGDIESGPYAAHWSDRHCGGLILDATQLPY